MSKGKFHLVRQTLLSFFQDMHIRVSIFLKDKVQTSNGRFVLVTGGALPADVRAPGTIRLCDAKGNETKTVSFSSGGSYQAQSKQGSFEMRGDRVTKLGTNMYSIARPVDTQAISKPKTTTMSDIDNQVPDPLAKAQLDLLSQLIGSAATQEKQGFRLNLFSSDQEEEEAKSNIQYQPMEASASQVIKIDATKKQKNEALAKIMGELTVEDQSQGGGGDDLLDLMDSA